LINLKHRNDLKISEIFLNLPTWNKLKDNNGRKIEISRMKREIFDELNI